MQIRSVPVLVLWACMSAALTADVPRRGAPPLGHSSADPASHERMHRNETALRACLRFAETAHPDYGRVFECLEPLASEGAAEAQFRLGLLHEEGSNGVKNPVKAAEWYRRAAGQGHAQSQVNLGVLYAKGAGVSPDLAEAARWYAKAAAQGMPQGLSNLGSAYLHGRGVRRDKRRAFVLFEQAATLGHAGAQNNLALMYANGEGVKTDLVEAHAWLAIAAVELPEAGKLQQSIAREMTAAQLEQARERAEALLITLRARGTE